MSLVSSSRLAFALLVALALCAMHARPARCDDDDDDLEVVSTKEAVKIDEAPAKPEAAAPPMPPMSCSAKAPGPAKKKENPKAKATGTVGSLDANGNSGTLSGVVNGGDEKLVIAPKGDEKPKEEEAKPKPKPKPKPKGKNDGLKYGSSCNERIDFGTKYDHINAIGRFADCTGFQVSQHVVVTAAHCIYHAKTKSFIDLSKTVYVTGRDKTTKEHAIDAAFVDSGYLANGGQNPAYDFGLLVLKEGHAVFPYFSPTAKETNDELLENVNTVGFPVRQGFETQSTEQYDSRGGQMRISVCKNDGLAFATHSLTTYGGQSGSPIFNADDDPAVKDYSKKVGKNPTIGAVGIHTNDVKDAMPGQRMSGRGASVFTAERVAAIEALVTSAQRSKGAFAKKLNSSKRKAFSHKDHKLTKLT